MSQSTFVKSTIILTVATLLSKILGSVYRIPLQNIAGDEVLGIFGIVYPVYMVALYLSVAGIPLAISKLIAEANTRGEAHKVASIYRTASILALCFGVLSFTLIFSLSGPLSSMLGGSEVRPALVVVGMTLLVAPYMAVYRGFFQGYGDMKPTAISQVIEQLVRSTLIIVIAIILVKLDYSNAWVAGGVMSASILGVLGSFIFLRFKYARSPYKVVRAKDYSSSEFKQYSSTILKMSIPIAIGSVTMALFNFVDSFTIPFSLEVYGVAASEITYQFGIYSRGTTLVQITTVFASAIILPLVPLITEKLVLNDREGTRDVIEQTQKMTHLISWPAAFGLLALTLPLNLALFTNVEGSWMIAIISFSSVFTSLTLLGTGILQGMSLARIGAFIILFGVGVKIVGNLVFIPLFGLDGAAYATLIVYFLIFVTNTYVTYRKIQYRYITPEIMKMIGAAIVMAAVVGLPTLMLDVASWSRLLALLYVMVAMVVGAAIYFLLLWFSKGINQQDLRKLPIIGKRVQKKYPIAGGNVAGSEQHSNTPPPSKEAPTQKERKQKMIKHKWLWGVIVALLLATSPFLIDRWQSEQGSPAYEIMIPYEHIVEAAKGSDYTVDEILEKFKANGLNNVSIEPTTLTMLEDNNFIKVDTEGELASLLRFTPYENDVDLEKHGFYISVPEDPAYRELLETSLNVEKVTFGEYDFYFLSDKENVDLKTPLGYDPVAIETIVKHDLDYTFRIGNDANPEVVQKLVNQLVDLKTDRVDGILPMGDSIVGAGTPERDQYIATLWGAGYYFYYVEQAKFKEFGAVGKVTDYDVVRFISIDSNREHVAKQTLDERVTSAVRAVKERNIRTIFYPLVLTGDISAHIDTTAEFLSKVTERMPDVFTLGDPVQFEKVQVPGWAKALILLAGVLYVYIASEILMSKWLRYASVAFMLLLAAAYVLLDKLLFVQAFALIIAVAAPSYAVIKTARETSSIGGILVRYLQAAAITAVGIWIGVSLLNGTMFMTGFEQFRGVTLVYVLPIAALFIHALVKHFNIDFRDDRDAVKKIKSLFNMEFKYWHLLLVAIATGVVFFYILRTGNSGTPLPYELQVRDWLENTLYSRPRTKEFLIGFPLYVLGLYVFKSNKLLGRIFLIGGVLGFLSMTNTFTHLHMPLNMSVLRTVYGLVFGFVIGLAYIGVYKAIMKAWAPLAKRWS